MRIKVEVVLKPLAPVILVKPAKPSPDYLVSPLVAYNLRLFDVVDPHQLKRSSRLSLLSRVL